MMAKGIFPRTTGGLKSESAADLKAQRRDHNASTNQPAS